MANPKKKPSDEPSANAERKLVPQPHGGALLPGAGGGPQPGSGRPPDEFRARLREMVSKEERLLHVETVLSNPDHPQWMAAWKWATEHGYGKPEQKLEHSGEVRHAVVILPKLHE